jgi:hypothetical protein
MVFRLLATLCFVLAIAVVLVRQPVRRGNAWGGVFGGMMLVAAGLARAWGGSGVELSEILLLQLDPQELDQYISSFFLMLGYGLALGAVAAMPWLTPGKAGEVGTVQRGSLFTWSFWREPVIRYLRWWLAIAVILLLWRLFGAGYR